MSTTERVATPDDYESLAGKYVSDASASSRTDSLASRDAVDQLADEVETSRSTRKMVRCEEGVRYPSWGVEEVVEGPSC